jgi:acetyl-CoA carboxylase biotin carboxyl carrier protein
MELNKRILDQLVELMQRDGLEQLRVRVGDLDVDLRMPSTRQAESATGHATPAAGASSAAQASTPKSTEAPPNVKKVLAPLVGVFYRAPAPNAKAFVELGDNVTEGQVLCILEAMKLMNEIVSEIDGKIVKSCLKDAELASLHQELFWIET